MAYIVMVDIVMAYIVMVDIVTAYVVMIDIVMAYGHEGRQVSIPAYTVMALFTYGLYSPGRYSYGLYSYGRYSYGLYSHGLCIIAYIGRPPSCHQRRQGCSLVYKIMALYSYGPM